MNPDDFIVLPLHDKQGNVIEFPIGPDPWRVKQTEGNALLGRLGEFANMQNQNNFMPSGLNAILGGAALAGVKRQAN